ncbi:hypothetical protein DFH09DRAFT_1291440 [Mycena vulgaris]|nr:hypothetical protein DFH09DRAFT_1291440 [Mycena vulgaris]
MSQRPGLDGWTRSEIVTRKSHTWSTSLRDEACKESQVNRRPDETTPQIDRGIDDQHQSPSTKQDPLCRPQQQLSGPPPPHVPPPPSYSPSYPGLRRTKHQIKAKSGRKLHKAIGIANMQEKARVNGGICIPRCRFQAYGPPIDIVEPATRYERELRRLASEMVDILIWRLREGVSKSRTWEVPMAATKTRVKRIGEAQWIMNAVRVKTNAANRTLFAELVGGLEARNEREVSGRLAIASEVLVSSYPKARAGTDRPHDAASSIWVRNLGWIESGEEAGLGVCLLISPEFPQSRKINVKRSSTRVI